MKLSEFLRKIKRWGLIKYYGFKNVHQTFLATFGLSQVSKDIGAGAYSYIGPNCIIYPKVTIGDFTQIANDVMIIGGDHNFRIPENPIVFNGREELRSTIIGKDCWIGARSIIIAGVTIGDGAIVAAGSVVTKDLDAYGVYGGVPVRKIKDRFKNADEIQRHKTMLAQPITQLQSSHSLSSAVEWRKKMKSGNA